MTQTDRDRLVALKKAKKKLITQKEAAEELGISERQVRRLLKALKRRGDQAVVHALRGLPSNRKIEEKVQDQVVRILSGEVYRGFGPTLAGEYLASEHGVEVSRETVRKWMMEAKLWRSRRQKIEKTHVWRPRRSRAGEMVQWDTSEHDWLEGRGPDLRLIGMIDDATSRWYGRFVERDSTAENMGVLEGYLRRFGRPLAFYTDKAGIFQTAVKSKRGEAREDKDQPEMPPTQIGRALRELGISWIGAHSPQAKGRIERSFDTAQDRLVKGMRVARVRTLAEANRYLEEKFLPWWSRTRTVAPAHPDDAHRPLDRGQDLAAILSHVENRQVRNDYTIQFESKVYQIERKDIRAGLRGARVRVEKRRDGSMAVRFGPHYLAVSPCEVRPKPAPQPRVRKRPPAQPGPGSAWNQHFQLHKAPKIWQAARSSGARPQEELP